MHGSDVVLNELMDSWARLDALMNVSWLNCLVDGPLTIDEQARQVDVWKRRLGQASLTVEICIGIVVYASLPILDLTKRQVFVEPTTNCRWSITRTRIRMARQNSRLSRRRTTSSVSVDFIPMDQIVDTFSFLFELRAFSTHATEKVGLLVYQPNTLSVSSTIIGGCVGPSVDWLVYPR